MQVGKPVDNAINRADACIVRCRGLNTIGELLKWVGIAKVSTAYCKQHDEAEGPETDRAVQFPYETSPPDLPVNDQAFAPRLDARPPHDGSGRCKDQHQKRSKAVNIAACFPTEQVVVQLEQLGNGPDAERLRIAEILPRVRIK